jgi:orotate phosphoribosyltransferase-like protein
MIDYELFSKIKNLKEQHGLTPAQISRELSLDTRTVVKWLEEDRFKQRKSTSKKTFSGC